MNSDFVTDRESADAKKVDAAIDAISAGRLDDAESLLLEVITNTPSNYSNSADNDDGIAIKFWDQTAFIHYVTWQKEHGGADRSITWISNAYPRGHYYMGFLCVKRKQFDRAIEFLDKGQSLEPKNPKFALEKAQALVYSGRMEEALALYDQVTEINSLVSARDLAVARRGRGFVMIEMGDLDNAENSFKSSLEMEPGNEVALNELLYIEHLRLGGEATLAETVPSTAQDPSICPVCGKQPKNDMVVSLDDTTVSICKKCASKLTKKWWQFWK